MQPCHVKLTIQLWVHPVYNIIFSVAGKALNALLFTICRPKTGENGFKFKVN